MRTLTIILYLCTGLTAQTPTEHWFGIPDSLAPMPPEARLSVRASYDHNTPYNYGYTLAAFNAIEAAGGQFLIAVGENSGGNYALRAKFVAARIHEIPARKVTPWQESRALQRLITDRLFDDRQARVLLDILYARHRGDWMSIWQNWNGRKVGQAEEVRAWIRFLRYELKWE